MPPSRIKLDTHTLNRSAPVGKTQLAVRTDLERVGRARGQILDRNCFLGTRTGSRGPRAWNRPTCRDRRTAYVIHTRFIDSRDTHKQFAGLPLSNTNDRGLSQRLRWDTVARTDFEAARRECYWVIIRGNLDIVRELFDHLDRHFSQLLLVPDGLLTAIERGNNRCCIVADRRHEGRHIDRWHWKRRIAHNSIVNRGEPRYKRLVRQTEETEQRFQFFYFCHTGTCLSLLEVLEFPATNTRIAGECRPGTSSPSR